MKKRALFYLPIVFIIASLSCCKVSKNTSKNTIALKNNSSLVLSQKAISIRKENLGVDKESFPVLLF
ncbi:hypothetical protein NU08_3417 [Flavobacterium anhuiense]|uniref:Lipoprotein n=1 Tax=Flavobacterium anhuiense TaxID=459526 RepID=A0A444VW56_9FLAO|nr:hypothetical protein [Flavobacterium anhuiense]RYJ37643.1 hypothetical protein NU08_3417 [Flavobacterium anhuiense]